MDSGLPIWVQSWLKSTGPALVFVAEKREEGPHIIAANEVGRKAFKE